MADPQKRGKYSAAEVEAAQPLGRFSPDEVEEAEGEPRLPGPTGVSTTPPPPSRQADADLPPADFGTQPTFTHKPFDTRSNVGTFAEQAYKPPKPDLASSLVQADIQRVLNKQYPPTPSKGPGTKTPATFTQTPRPQLQKPGYQPAPVEYAIPEDIPKRSTPLSVRAAGVVPAETRPHPHPGEPPAFYSRQAGLGEALTNWLEDRGILPPATRERLQYRSEELNPLRKLPEDVREAVSRDPLYGKRNWYSPVSLIEQGGIASAEFLKGTAAPQNWPWLGAGYVVPAETVMADIVHSGTSAYFAGQLAKGTLQQGAAAVQEFQQGDKEAAVRDAIGTLFNAALATSAGHHAAKGFGGIPEREQARRDTDLRNLRAGLISAIADRADAYLSQPDMVEVLNARAAARANIEHRPVLEVLGEERANLRDAFAQQTADGVIARIQNAPRKTLKELGYRLADLAELRKGTTIEGEIPRPAAPSTARPQLPAQPTTTPGPVAEAAAAMAKAQPMDPVTQAATAVARAQGIVPPPAPVVAPPVPASPPQYPEINDATVADVARAIQSLPPEQQEAAIIEAHDHLTNALVQQGKAFVGGKLYVIKNDAHAAQIAANLINEQVEKADAERARMAQESSEAPSPILRPTQPAPAPQAATAPQREPLQTMSQPSKPETPMGAFTPADVEASYAQKGDRVAWLDQGGEVRTGTVKYAGPLVSRVKPEDGGKEWTGATSKLRSVEEMAQAPAPGAVGTMAVADISQNPTRFQFKAGTDAEGVGQLLKGQTVFNPDLAGVITVWRDPADGKTYVVNGHHRLELARRTGQATIPVRHIRAQDTSEARAIGALQNIAEGRGSPIDAAKFFRESSYTPERLDKLGISMGEATARDGVALSRLDDSIFGAVVQGDIPAGRAVVIGEATADHAEQRAIVDLVDKAESTGKRVNNDTLAELIRLVKGAGKTQETTASLFGEQHVTKSLALEKAEISAFVKQQLAKDKALFGFVAKSERARKLAEAEAGTINVEKSKAISTEVAQAGELYDKLSNRAGPINDILEKAALRLANGDNANVVKQNAYSAIRAEVSATLGPTAREHAEGIGAPEERGTAPARTEETPPSVEAPEFLGRRVPLVGAEKVSPTLLGWASFKYRPPIRSRGIPAIIELDDISLEVFNRITLEQVLGTVVMPGSAEALVRLFRLNAEAFGILHPDEPGGVAKLQEIADIIERAAKENGNDGVVFVSEYQGKGFLTRSEELFHSMVQVRAGAGRMEAGVPAHLADHPVFAKLVNQVIERNEAETRGGQTKMFAVAEAMVDIWNGEYRNRGITEEEAEQAATEYWRSVPSEARANARKLLTYLEIYARKRKVQIGEFLNGPAQRTLARIGEEDRGTEGRTETESFAGPGGGTREAVFPGSDYGSAYGPNRREGPETSGVLAQRKAGEGLSPEELEQFVASAGKHLTVIPAGEQGALFGEAEPTYKLLNQKTGESTLVTQRQLDRLRLTESAPGAIDQGALFSRKRPEEEPVTFGLTLPGLPKALAALKKLGTGAKPVKPSFTFSDPEMEKEFQDAHGLPETPLWQKIKESAERLGHLATRTYEHLPRGAKFEPARFALKRLEKQRMVTRDQAAEALARIVADLGPQEYNLFERAVLLRDLAATAKEGKALPRGFTPENVEAELARLSAELDKHPKAAEAIERRDAEWQTLKENYLEAMQGVGFDATEKISRPDYFRHQVLEYAEATGVFGSGRKLKTPVSRGFLKLREGSALPINTDYLQAEYEVLAQMRMDVEIAKTIKLMDEQYNIAQDLKRQAVEQNEDAVMDLFKDIVRSSPDAALLSDIEVAEQASKMFRATLNRKQAQAITRLTELAARGELPSGDAKHDFTDLIETLSDHYNEEAATKADLEENYEGPAKLDEQTVAQLIRYAAWMMRQPTEGKGKSAAALLFKGMAEKKQYIKEKLGEKYATWRDLVPDGYTLWQPREGTQFYFTTSIPEEVAQRLYEDAAKEVGISKEQLRKVLARGARFKEFVIPEELADTLDNLRPPITGMFGRVPQWLVTKWKEWQLVSPRRVFKYNLRNLSGDAEAVFVGNPGAFAKVPQAISDLLDYYRQGKKTDNLRAWVERGGVESLLQAQEMGDIDKLDYFKRIYQQEQSGTLKQYPSKAWHGYWRLVRIGTDFREAILRYAAYLDYLEQLESGHLKNYGGSIPSEVDALDGAPDKAFKLSNDLLGAYDDITALGQTLRKYMPFYSWQEINPKRYYRFFKNAFRDAGGKRRSTGGAAWEAGKRIGGLGARRAPFLAYRAGKLLIKIMGLWAALSAWNRVMFPDEEKDLPKEVRDKPHIIFGRDKQGQVLAFTRIGMLGDILDWFGIDTPNRNFEDWLDGRKTAAEVAKDVFKGPPNKLWSMMGPLTKLPVEFVGGKTTYPDVFHPRPVADRWRNLAQQFSLTREFDYATGRPTRGWADSITSLFVDQYDHGATAYYEILDAKRKFLMSKGKGGIGGDFSLSPKAEALRNLKAAFRFGDERAIQRYEAEFFALGGKPDDIRESLERMNPLAGMSTRDRLAFQRSLTQDEREALSEAIRFWRSELMGPAIRR